MGRTGELRWRVLLGKPGDELRIAEAVMGGAFMLGIVIGIIIGGYIVAVWEPRR